MIVNVYYKQGKYDELIRYAETALKSKDIRNADEVYLLVAEAHYRKEDYPKAAQYFKESVAKSRAKPAADIAYRLGYSLYKTGDYKGAIEGFKPAAASPKDSLSQYAAYHLGNSYLQAGNKTFALNAFDQARKGKFSKAIAEEAAFSYAKVSYDAGNSVQATTALKDFVKAYPDSKHEGEANELLGEAYLNSNNYEEAIAHIERIKTRTPRIEAAYQRVTFNHVLWEIAAIPAGQAPQNCRPLLVGRSPFGGPQLPRSHQPVRGRVCRPGREGHRVFRQEPLRHRLRVLQQQAVRQGPDPL
jgi:tetratricopeptide (TPR) repeat protein